MKTTIITALLIAVLLAAVGIAQDQKAADGENGRYRLFSAEHDIAGRVVVQEKAILRIDTRTGETRSWVNGIDKNGKLLSFWAPIDEH